jgi:hypothetical protein
MTRNPFRIAFAATLYAVGLAWIINTNPWSGPELMRLSETHGVHENDWVTPAMWGAAMVTIFPARSAASFRRLQRAIVDRSS